MRLEIQSARSPDLDPPSEGVPADLDDFGVLVQVAVGKAGQPGTVVFGLTVCSPSELARVEPGTFIAHTLVLERFSWEAVLARLAKLLAHAHSAATWNEVQARLYGYLHPSDS